MQRDSLMRAKSKALREGRPSKYHYGSLRHDVCRRICSETQDHADSSLEWWAMVFVEGEGASEPGPEQTVSVFKGEK